MNISTLMNQISQTISDAAQGNSTITPGALEESIRNGLAVVFSKGNGQFVTGEVLQTDGSDILLSLGENQLLQAKLQGSTSPKTGQLMTFQIQNASGSKITLMPLYENLNQNSNIASALKAAGIPMTDQTIQMVKDMMEEGLPIDKQSLYQMNRAMNANPGIPTISLAQMQRLGIPLESNMIQQFQNYQNYEHQIANSISDITDSFTETFRQLLGEEDTEGGIQLAKTVLQQFVTEEGGAEASYFDFDDAAKENLLKEWSELDIPQERLQKLFQKESHPNEFLKELLSQMENSLIDGQSTTDFGEKLLKVFHGKAFRQLFQESVAKQFFLEPAEVGQEGKVDRLYERLNEQLRQLNHSLSGAERQDTPLARTVTNLSNNLDFMNAMNQNFTYVQIPLKMYQQNASGELFVYTNKKSLAQKDGNVSALLHLDMEHLGSVDVHVSLSQGEKVSTKFYLQDDETLDLIATHIDTLNERLNKRGYSMNAEFINRDGRTNVVGELLKESKNISILSGTSFDVRA